MLAKGGAATVEDMPRIAALLCCLSIALTLAVGAANVVVLRAGDGAAANPSAVPRADAALVLGAGIRPDGGSTPALRERLLASAELMRAGRVPRLVLSGGPEEVAVMRAELLDLGLDPQTLVSDPAGTSTLASVHNAAARPGLRSVTVVTQRFHMARALWLARSRGLDAHGLVADGRVPHAPRDGGAREILARAKAVASVALGA
jgi:SanA protein